MTLFQKLTDPRNSALLFAAALAAMYALLPFLLNAVYFEDRYFFEVGWICLIGCAGLVIGFQLPIFDSRFRPDAQRFVINATAFHVVVWVSFIAFLLIAFSTASSIPILKALSGASADELSQSRGAFLKGRVGLESALLYISTIFVSTLLPYSLVQLFMEKSRWRYALAAVFFLFSISFLQKALFLNMILPLMYFAAQRLKVSSTKIVVILAACLVIIYLAVALSMGDDEAAERLQPDTDVQSFFSATFLPSSSFEMLVWRAGAVPLFTATDSLLVFDKDLHEQPLLGATSSSISALFGMENVNIERMVFAHQFGSWNDIANANAVFLVDAFVNFGWLGVCVFSLFVGQSLRWFYKSSDQAFKSLWMLYCFGLFSGSLIGMMLSNGFLLLFLFVFFIRLRNKNRETLNTNLKSFWTNR